VPQIRDLLIEDPASGPRLEIRATGTAPGVVTVQIPALSRVDVSSVEQAMLVYARGCRNRAVAATNVHEHSSRSHCVLTIEVSGVYVAFTHCGASHVVVAYGPRFHPRRVVSVALATAACVLQRRAAVVRQRAWQAEPGGPRGL
jgi:hypothetical protein